MTFFPRSVESLNTCAADESAPGGFAPEVAGVHEGRGEAAGRHVERNLPPVVDHGLEGQPHLAHNLRPHVQRHASRVL